MRKWEINRRAWNKKQILRFQVVWNFLPLDRCVFYKTLTVLTRTNVLQALRGTSGNAIGAKALVLHRGGLVRSTEKHVWRCIQIHFDTRLLGRAAILQRHCPAKILVPDVKDVRAGQFSRREEGSCNVMRHTCESSIRLKVRETLCTSRT